MKFIRTALSAAAVVAAFTSVSAHAALTTFASFSGSGVDMSTDGWGSTSQSGVISANVPAGATVLAAYLYTSTFFNTTLGGIGGTLAGNAVNYAANLGTTSFLTAARADVTSILKPLIDGGPGGLYNFNITETSSSQDGSALVVIFKDPAVSAVQSVGILDGFSAFAGDSTAINFSNPLNTAAPGFFAEMRLGIGFSCCGQRSRVTVNGTTITEQAGNNDDGDAQANGALITMGGDDDAVSPLNPTYAQDHERYNLVPQINNGDTSIQIRTVNPSNDDNIFLAAFRVLGEAGFNEPPPNKTPEPMSLALVGLALAGLGVQRRLAKRG